MRNYFLLNNKDELIKMFMLETSYANNYYEDVVLIDLQMLYPLLPLNFNCFKNNIYTKDINVDILNKHIIEDLILGSVKYIDDDIVDKKTVVDLLKCLDNTIDKINENYKYCITYSRLSNKIDYDEFVAYITKIINILKMQIKPYVVGIKQILKTDEEQITLPNKFWYNCELDMFLYNGMFRLTLPIVIYKNKGGYNDDYTDRSR